MRRATSHHPTGTWPQAQAGATVTLEFDDRHRRRIRLTDDAGEPFLLDLASARTLRDGDGLALDGGGFICVRAAPEAVIDARGTTPAHAARLAWHVGNRHTPLQVLADGALRIRDDHVLADMLDGLGAVLERKRAPFSPEPGAYAAGNEPHRQDDHHQAHDHSHGGHGHDDHADESEK
jgi:urease accessory protein